MADFSHWYIFISVQMNISFSQNDLFSWVILNISIYIYSNKKSPNHEPIERLVYANIYIILRKGFVVSSGFVDWRWIV